MPAVDRALQSRRVKTKEAVMPTRFSAPLFAIALFTAGGCGPVEDGAGTSAELEAGDPNAPEVSGGVSTLDAPTGDGTVSIASALAWWHSAITYAHIVYGWHDT